MDNVVIVGRILMFCKVATFDFTFLYSCRYVISSRCIGRSLSQLFFDRGDWTEWWQT